MSRTGHRSARAISGALFLAAAWPGWALRGPLLAAVGVVGACGPALTRADGRLEVSVVNLDPAADALRLQVAAPDVGGRYEAPMALGGGRHVVESVPAGPVEVEVEATAGGVVIQSGAAALQMVGGAVIPLSIPLRGGTGAPPLVVSSPVAVAVGPLDGADVVGGRLEGRGVAAAADLSVFAAEVQARLGGTPEHAGVGSVRVALLREASQEAEKLQDVWREALEVRMSAGETPVLVGSAPLGEDTAALELTVVPGVVVREALEQGHELTVFVAGDAKRSYEPELRAHLEVTLTLTSVEE